jgi:hypothetical protein
MRSNLMRIVVVAFAALVQLSAVNAASAAQSPWDKPIDDVRRDIAALLRCTWNMGSCTPGRFGGTLNLQADAAGTRVETVELNPLVLAHPRNSRIENLNRDVTLKVVAYFLPQWKERRAWIEHALWHASGFHNRDETEADGVKILAENLTPMRLEDTFVLVVLTKKPSLDEFKAKWD